MSNTDEENDLQAELAAWELLAEARKERDEARELCRWALPRLRAMSHDFDVTGTGWACAEKMEQHPEIFIPNAGDVATAPQEPESN